jgi:hypothetical protein
MEDKRRIRECLLWGGAVAMLFAAGLLVRYLKDVPVSPSYYRLMSFLHCVCSVAALSCLAALPFRVKQPPSSFATVWRVFLGVLFAFLGLEAGSQYIHLCYAGSRFVEGAAFFGTPLVAGLVIVGIRRLTVAGVVAACWVTGVWLLARPYLDMVHGN